MSAKREGKREMVEHFSHQHLLVFSRPRNKHETARCFGCWKEVADLAYCCPEFECKFYLHKACAKLAHKIHHPFHSRHPLSLRAKAPYIRCFCNFCGWLCMGFVYCCADCDFHLDVSCAKLQLSIAGNFDKLQHFNHEHPLTFNEKHNKKVNGDCEGCRKPLSGPIYRCLDCSNFDLHKDCAELPLEMDHPFHPSHPLILLSISPNYPTTVKVCNFCRSYCSAFVYHCSSCDFYLDIKCASLKQFIAGNFPKLEYFCHKHPLSFLEMHRNEIKDSCSACAKQLSGPIYSCVDCGFDLHKACAELPLTINHPFHCICKDLLLIQAEWLNPSPATCSFCNSGLWGVVYHCVSCKFNLHITCALLLPINSTKNALLIQHFSHIHQLIFVEKHGDEVNGSCHGCGKLLSGPIYSCVECKFHLHKKCAELPREIDHSSHRRHSLVLLAEPPTHQKGCSCYLCQKQFKGFVYYCSDCDFGNMIEDVEDVSLPRKIKVAIHEHPFKLLLRPISFICDFCGINGDRTSYVCTKCDLVIHKNCISLPSAIQIMRHPHPISFRHFLHQKKSHKRMCNICQGEVNTEYGSYYCYLCHQYIAHVQCATDDYIWDRKANFDDEDQRSKGALSLITSVVEEKTHGGDVIAVVIKHAFHQHILILTDEAKDGETCNGCMQPLSTPFFSCEQCQFFLHKICVELPRVKPHPLHRHPLILHKPNSAEYPRRCSACLQYQHGFTYNCEKCNFHIDIECSLLSDTLSHESHGEHLLYLDHKYEGNCSACGEHIPFQTGAYRCKHCETFAVSFKCIKLPRTACYKYDKHRLTLTHFDRVDPSQCYCDICEETRDPKSWFYHCRCCDNSVHLQCILGELPFIKLGSMYMHHVHPHRLTFVRNIWDCPPCSLCRELCINQALECTKLGCNFIIHWKCRNSFQASVRKQISDITTELDDEDQKPNVNEEICSEEDGKVTTIKHRIHEHFLVLGEEVKVDKNCDVCVMPISAPFYGCERCLFFLHKQCAELPRQKRHPFHKHQLTLIESDPAVANDVSTCSACLHTHHGFAYMCNRCEFEIDIQCSLLSDILRHPSHEHELFFDPKYTGNCSACCNNTHDKGAYRCWSGCEYVLDFRCITQPPKVKSRFHEHPLHLIHHDDSDQHYCAICEEKRHPKKWFYHCVDCYISFHPECVLGELPFVKIGSIYDYFGHPHFLTFVEKLTNFPPCTICGKLCKSQALECKKSECDFVIHWKCRGQSWQKVRSAKRR